MHGHGGALQALFLAALLHQHVVLQAEHIVLDGGQAHDFVQLGLHLGQGAAPGGQQPGQRNGLAALRGQHQPALARLYLQPGAGGGVVLQGVLGQAAENPLHIGQNGL